MNGFTIYMRSITIAEKARRVLALRGISSYITRGAHGKSCGFTLWVRGTADKAGVCALLTRNNIDCDIP